MYNNNMSKFLSHKIRIYPNNKQATYLTKACGIKRFAYNWALSTSKKLYKEGTKSSGYDLSKRFNKIKYEQFPFVTEVTKWAPQKAIYNAFDAYKRWWKKLSSAPSYKKKGKSKDSFYINSNSIKVKNNYLQIPKLKTKIYMSQQIRFQGEIKHVTISRNGNRWYASFAVQLPDSYVYSNSCENQEVVGIDVGITNLAVTSEKEYISNPQWLLRKERKLKHLQKAVSRKRKGSNNRKKSVVRLNNCYRKVRDCRKDFLQKLTTEWIKKYKYIGVETLDVKEMQKNKNVAKYLTDPSFYEIRRQLEYKTQLAGSFLVSVAKYFPSSKTCSSCGTVKEQLSLSTRTYTCSNCGLQIDRDLNAAYNLKKVALRHRETINACGENKVTDLRISGSQRSRNLAAVNLKVAV